MMRQVVLLIMMFMSQFSWGQNLTGKVVDAKSNAIEFANVALYDKDSTFLQELLPTLAVFYYELF